MIVYPYDWKIDYTQYIKKDKDLKERSDIHILNTIYDILKKILSDIKINNLAYSGGIDSTIMLSLMKQLYPQIFTYTISSRDNHPDIVYARLGSNYYETNHKEIIVIPSILQENEFIGDNAVRQLFENCDVKEIICCDGIDEFMCGYYDHQKNPIKYYEYYISELLEKHLIPLDKNSQDTKVYLPYLNHDLLTLLSSIPSQQKVDKENRKKIMLKLGNSLNIPNEILKRNKYGFIDAFREQDK